MTTIADGFRRALLACAAVSALALTACGPGQDSAAPQVASLPSTTSGPASGAASASPETGFQRTQLRLDSSQADIVRAWVPYNDCLKANGIRTIPQRNNEPDMNDNSAIAKAAEKKCADRIPLQPPELDPAKNPDFQDDYQNYISCLNKAGMHIHAIQPFGTGWTFDDGTTPSVPEDQQVKVDTDCQVGAFSGKH